MNAELVPFVVDPPVDVTSEINRLHFENLEAARSTIQRAMRIGELLSQTKSNHKHGEWLPWLKANVAFDERTAQRYVKVYENRDRLKYDSVSYLTDAYRALTISDRPPERESEMAKYYFTHPVTAMFPNWKPEDMDSMADDIATNGLIDPITLCEGMILDGWLRYKACYLAEVPQRFVEYTGNDPMHFVIVRNFGRFNQSQRAMLLVMTAFEIFGLDNEKQIPAHWIKAAKV
jgi:Protein of unknown function (DUF3102)